MSMWVYHFVPPFAQGVGGQFTSRRPPDWSRIMGLGGIIETFILLGTIILVLWCLLSISDKRRRRRREEDERREAARPH